MRVLQLGNTDLVGARGNRDNFVAWDEAKNRPAVWVSSRNEYRDPGVKNALEGEYREHFRISLTAPDDQIEEGLEKICEAAN